MRKTEMLWVRGRILVLLLFLIAPSAGIPCPADEGLMHRMMADADYLEDWEEGDGTIVPEIVYDAAKGLKYDLYLPAASAAEPDRPTGAMLFIHGGSWTGGSRAEQDYACKRFVKLGYVTATLDYTLYKEGDPTSFFTMLDDIGRCLEHLRETAAARHYPVKAVALSGLSAGGHLAMLYAYSRAKTSPIPIAFVFQQVGPSVFTPEAWPDRPDLSWGVAQIGSGVEMTREEYEDGRMAEAVRSISPALLVDESTVPTIAAYGGKDTLVPSPHAWKLREALAAHKVPHEFILYRHSGHFLCGDPACARRYRQAVLEFCEKYF